MRSAAANQLMVWGPDYRLVTNSYMVSPNLQTRGVPEGCYGHFNAERIPLRFSAPVGRSLLISSIPCLSIAVLRLYLLRSSIMITSSMPVSRKPIGDDGLHVANGNGLEHVPSQPSYNYYPQDQPPTWHSNPRYSQIPPHKEEPQEHLKHASQKQERRKLCGIPIIAFWMLVALILGLVAAIAVVGGVLGSRANSKADVTPTATRQPMPVTVTSTAAAVLATETFACESATLLPLS